MNGAGRLGATTYRSSIKFITILFFLGFVFLYTSNMRSGVADSSAGRMDPLGVPRRHLLRYSDDLLEDDSGDGGDDDEDDTNCTLPRSHKNYNDSCSFVLDNCQDQYQLFNYLRFVSCNLSAVQVTPTEV